VSCFIIYRLGLVSKCSRERT